MSTEKKKTGGGTSLALLPIPIYTFLDALIAKLEQDAVDEDQPEEAKHELRNWAKNVHTVRRACRERDILLGVVRPEDLVRAHDRLHEAAEEAGA